MDYVSLQKHKLIDAQKHLSRANDYINNNKYSHAAGSLAKACKKLQNYEDLKYPDDLLFMKHIMDNLAAKIAKSILSGT